MGLCNLTNNNLHNYSANNVSLYLVYSASFALFSQTNTDFRWACSLQKNTLLDAYLETPSYSNHLLVIRNRWALSKIKATESKYQQSDQTAFTYINLFECHC